MYETPEISQTHKRDQCKVFLNVMFLFLEYGDRRFYHYSLRALAEFFSNQKTARELSKRLNCDSLLRYKQQKKMLGHHILDEFSKKLSLSTGESQSAKQPSGMKKINRHHELVFDDVQEKLRDVMRRLDSDRPESHGCFILCLKIISQLIRRQLQDLQLSTQAKSLSQGPQGHR